MKARNKFDRRVESLEGDLSSVITKDHIKWAKENLFKKYVYRTKKRCVCFECGNEWQRDKEETKLNYLLDTPCPKCKTVLKHWSYKCRHNQTEQYYYVAERYKEFQVLRYVCINKYERVNKPAHYHYNEVIQHWINSEGKHAVRAHVSNAFGYYHSENPRWAHTGLISFKRDLDKYYIRKAKIYPHKRFIPQLRRNGFRYAFHGLHPVAFIIRLLSNPRAETFLKTKQFDLLRANWSKENEIEQYWPSIKICLRNNFIITDPSIWFDHLEILQRLGKDIHSSKYICPEDLMHEHRKYNERVRKIQLQEKIENLRTKIDRNDPIYADMKGKYLELSFTNGIVTVEPLIDVKEFLVESDYMHHCLFSSEYYKKEDCLILSAHKRGVKLETIELNLPHMELVQVRGKHNRDTEYHDSIIRLVRSNLKTIKKIRDAG